MSAGTQTRRSIAYNARLDHFAELLSQGLEVPVIAARMGIGRGYAYRLLAEIRARLGWQAV